MAAAAAAAEAAAKSGSTADTRTESATRFSFGERDEKQATLARLTRQHRRPANTDDESASASASPLPVGSPRRPDYRPPTPLRPAPLIWHLAPPTIDPGRRRAPRAFGAPRHRRLESESESGRRGAARRGAARRTRRRGRPSDACTGLTRSCLLFDIRRREKRAPIQPVGYTGRIP